MDGETAGPTAEEREQSRLNAEIWAHGDFVSEYATTELRNVESTILARYRQELSGRTLLELGCGAGRLTGHLGELSDAVQAIDLSPNMIAYCRKRYPKIEFSEGDLRDLSRFDDGSFTAVFAPFNVLDVLGDRERDDVLKEIHRVLMASGLLIMSSHNRGAVALVTPPRPEVTANPLGLLASIVYFARRWANRRRLTPLERTDADHAILNDSAHDYSLLHYYIARDVQERKLAARGFELLECLDLDGGLVERGARAEHCTELHYVARHHGS